MRKNKFVRRKQQSIISIVLDLIILLIIGYAILQSNLNINGTASINNPTWNIHWENVQVTNGSVSASTPTIDSAQTTVTYSVVLNLPGDYYEFTVDAVNSGTIDGMIESVTSKLNGATITTLPAYLEYAVTYDDEAELAANQLLAAGDTETYKVRVKYKEDINVNQIPSTNQTLNLQFTIKYKQADENAAGINRLYNVLKDAATEGTYAKKYTGTHHDSFTEEPSKDIYHWWADNDTNGTAILDMNNVIFAGFCWQMIRTMDTGGVKLVYNGVPSSGQCNNSGADTSIGISAFNSNYNSPAYVGYMYNPSTLISYIKNKSATEGSLFGTGVTYSRGWYTLTNTSTAYDETHHYTCNNTTGTCTTVRYYYHKYYYTQIGYGRTVEQCLEDMLSTNNVNQTDSTIKTTIDNWYASNMTSYTSKLEDTIFCTDRSINDLGGWNPNGGSVTLTDSARLQFKNYSSNTNLSCTNITDKFSMANTKAQLTYPIGLLTYPETYLLNNNNIRKTGEPYWLASPYYFGGSSAAERLVSSSGSNTNNGVSSDGAGVRPVVSLKPGTLYTSGDGSKNNPYIVN
ncbi:MAG: hypothetical protein IJG97_05675 [Bacilli bacterium]|nr:hypothetical protein [Bacilli bacterium]